MSLRLTVPSVFDLLVLAKDMSPEEIGQFESATGLGFSPDTVARLAVKFGGIEYLVVDEANQPVSAFGCFEVGAGVFQTWMVSRADAFERHGVRLTRIVRRTLRDLLKVPEIRRIQTYARADRAEARRWYIEGLGMDCEGVLRRYYPDGSDAAVYSAIKGI